MRIIDLLNKIANGEEVPKFWWNGCIHEVQKEYGTNKYDIFDTYCKKYKRIELEDLNEEIKFVEEEKKIPEKLDYCEENTFMIKCKENSYLTRKEIRLLDSNFKEIGNKINSIIDCLKVLKK